MKNLNKEESKTCIVNLGYIDLLLAARFSFKGYDVTRIAIKEEKIKRVRF